MATELQNNVSGVQAACPSRLRTIPDPSIQESLVPEVNRKEIYLTGLFLFHKPLYVKYFIMVTG